MGVFEPILREKEKDKPKKQSVEEMYGYEPEAEEQEEQDNKSFLDKMAEDLIQKREKAMGQVKQVK